MPCLAEIYEPRSDMSLETAQRAGGGPWPFLDAAQSCGRCFPTRLVSMLQHSPASDARSFGCLGSPSVFLALSTSL